MATLLNEIILSGNCYWCTEAVFQQIKGCTTVEPGYYRITEFGSTTDKVEAVKVEFDSGIITLDSILDVFFISHNPTLVSWEKENCVFPLNRSSVIVSTVAQKILVKQYLAKLKQFYDEPIQTKVFINQPASFIELPKNKHNYYNNNPQDGYCTSIINPKLNLLRKKYQTLLKKD